MAAAYGVTAEVNHARGVPPVDNEAGCTEVLAAATLAAEGDGSVVPTAQSLGGEDFAWYLEQRPRRDGRLGTATPGDPVMHDLHQGTSTWTSAPSPWARGCSAPPRCSRSRGSPAPTTCDVRGRARFSPLAGRFGLRTASTLLLTRNAPTDRLHPAFASDSLPTHSSEGA